MNARRRAPVHALVRCSLSLPAFDSKNSLGEPTFGLARVRLEPDFEAGSIGLAPIAPRWQNATNNRAVVI